MRNTNFKYIYLPKNIYLWEIKVRMDLTKDMQDNVTVFEGNFKSPK